MENQDQTDRLIARWLAGDCTPEEAEQLFRWAEESEENRKYLDDIHKISSASSHHMPVFDPAQAWESLQMKMAGNRKNKLNLFQWAAAASILVAIAVFTFYSVLTPEPVTASFKNSSSVSVHDTLPDGSAIVLAAGASVVFIESSNERTAILEGTAFFTVEPSDKQFLVKTDHLLIQDIGTAFDVVEDAETIEVFVSDGIVQINSGSQEVIVKAGQGARYAYEYLELLDTASNTKMSSWRTRAFTFKAAPLADVIRELNLSYGNIFSIESPESASCQVSVTFSQERPEIIADVLSTTLGMETIKKDGRFVLTGSCN